MDGVRRGDAFASKTDGRASKGTGGNWLSWMRRSESALIGVDIGQAAIKMVELGGTKHAPELLRYVIEPLPFGSISEGGIARFEQVGEAIERARRRLGSRVRAAVTALPSHMIINKRITVAKPSAEIDLEGMVEDEAAQFVPFPMEELSLDFSVLSDDGQALDILMAAARRDNVDDRVAAIEAGGLEPHAVDVEAAALYAAASRSAAQTHEHDFAVVDIGSDATRVHIFHKGEAVFMREMATGGHTLTQNIQRTFRLSASDAERAKRGHAADAELLPPDYASNELSPFVDSLAADVARALAYYTGTQQKTSALNKIWVCGGTASLPDVVEALALRTGLIAARLNPFTDMRIHGSIKPKQLAVDAASLAAACGLALYGLHV